VTSKILEVRCLQDLYEGGKDMLKKETSVSKMEASQFIEIIGIAKKSNHLLLKTCV